MEFDDILNDIGVFGRFQWRLYGGVFMCSVAGSVVNLAQVFVGGDMDHWCHAPELEHLNCSSAEWPGGEQQCMEMMKSIAIPHATSSTDEYERCIRYDLTGVEASWTSSLGGWETSDYTNDTIACDEGWVYDTSQFQTTIISEFDLVCNKRSLPDLAQSMFYVGMLLGSAIFGAMSDRYGRYRTYVICVTLGMLSTFLTAASNSYAMYTIVRTIAGGAGMGVYLVVFTLFSEFVGPSKRTFVSYILSFWIAIGLISLGGLAYLIRQWRLLMFVLGLPALIVCACIPLVTESPRWLISKGRFTEAEAIIRKVAYVNGKDLPKDYFRKWEKSEKQLEESQTNKGSATDLLFNRDIRIKTLNLMWVWCVVSLVYYGLSLNTGALGGDIYVSFIISSVIEMPAHLYVLFALDWFGRKPNLCGSLILGGISCIVSVFIPLGAWRTTVVMLGKFFISISFTSLYIFTVEQYPTPVRNMGLGLCSTFARLGSISAPLILISQDYWKPLPYVIFGVFAITGGLCTLALPETAGRNLPESVNEKTQIFDDTLDNETPTIDNSDQMSTKKNHFALDNSSFIIDT